IISSFATLVLGIVATRYDFRAKQREAKIEEKKSEPDSVHKTNDEWERLYKTQKEANDDLKTDYANVKKELDLLKKQVDSLTDKIGKLNTGFTEKEKGYLMQIELLQDENDNLREANQILQEQLAEVKGGV
ncbi:MAG TPA: hypothetical protein VK118_06200, partial [Tetragenococcus sp.]|nr:hypothetical protein [Tetragenococcus sp.]